MERSDATFTVAARRAHNGKLERALDHAVPIARFLDRELSHLAFNERVLALAERASVPLAERLRYVCIVSSNLDEFFEIRISELMGEMRESGGINQASPLWESFTLIADRAHALVDHQYRIYNEQIIPALARARIVVLSHSKRSASQRDWVREYFEREVRPLLSPIGLDPAHPFPQVMNKTLNFIVQLNGKDAFGRPGTIAIVKVPRVLPRVIPLPSRLTPQRQAFVLLSSVIRAHLADLFPRRGVAGFSQFRVTRDSELWVDEREVSDLRQALQVELTQRHFGNAVRLEVLRTCPDALELLLREQFQLPPQTMYRVAGPVNLVRLNQLVDHLNRAEHRFPPLVPAWPRQVAQGSDLFEAIRRGDILLHHPFESFEPVVEFLRQAVADPKVVAIRMTLYRTGTGSVLVDLLEEAARQGKEVTVVVELKARFDEEANINVAERLEAVGAQIVYGLVGLKTHAKLLLVLRRESSRGRERLVRYAHLGTGNYHPTTTKLYTDFGMLTAHGGMCTDVERVFMHLTSLTRVERLTHLWLAPFTLHKRNLAAIANEARLARAGKPARIIAKVNALVDEATINALYEASSAGVRIDLIVRGACSLRPGVKGLSDNVQVRSVVGRFLEHHRIYYYGADGKESVYLASADWMGRNLFRRIEVAFPVLDPKLKRRVIDEGLRPYLDDTAEAWTLLPSGEYAPPRQVATGQSAQRKLLALLTHPDQER
ncbi:MAG TPA: polyphosphate kinase 1 [Burkholderiaceae bacterium]|nr:polyphosphate kinase 1 [Burkholderiaceae bacterium]